MAGFEVGIINIIADNLRDRYKSGFPVLKEIIQNTDDAASLSNRDVELDFGFTHGIPEANHPLLNGPAIFFLNNGSFSEQDARAVKSFGLNSKAADSGSIGKFGLGMKSVFHFCEAFFWLARDGELQKEEILNPWSGNVEFPPPQSSWDNFSSGDADKIKQHLQDLLGNLKKDTPFFLLWLPLRQKQQLIIEGEEVGSIISEFPGDNLKQVDFLFEPGLKRNLAELLPLLRHIICMRCWKAGNGRAPQLQYSVQLKKGAQRNTYPATVKKTILSGNVIYGTNKENAKHTLKFVGYENRAKEEKLKELRKSEHWPESYVRDEMGRECRQRDKAKGHCAVTFSRSSEKTSGSLDIQWAVFLPVDVGREHCLCHSDYSYTLTLHGFFFIDAGRVTIEGFNVDDEGIVFPPLTENNLRAAWNYYLRKHTLLLLIPSLAEFTIRTKMGAVEKNSLFASIKDSKFFKEYRANICQQYHLILVLTEKGALWRGLSAKKKLLPLPTPPQKQTARPWETFPNLRMLEENYVFIQKGAPHLTSKGVPQWDEVTLLTVLKVSGAHVFSNQNYAKYLNLFLQEDAVTPFLGISPLQRQLKKIVKKGFSTLGADLTQVTSAVQEFVRFILPEHRYVIRTDAIDIVRQLQIVDSDFLFLPREFDPPESHGLAKLPVDDGLLLLENLDHQLGDYEAAGKHKKAQKCRNVILEVLKGFDRNTRHEVLLQGRKLKIINAYDCQRQQESSFTVKELEEVRSCGTLFLYTQGINLKERLGLAPKLQAVFKMDKVLLLTSETATMVFGSSNHGVPQCLASGCLAALGDSCKTLTSKSNRAELINVVSGVDLQGVENNVINGFRYLLHEDENLFNGNATLWVQGYQQNPVWSKLWEQLVGNEADNTLVPRALAEEIPQNKWQFLNLREIDQQGILDDIKEKGADFIDPASLNDHERAEVLLSAKNDIELWKNLPLHKTVSGKFVSITNFTYLEPSCYYPAELNERLQFIVKDSDSDLFRIQTDTKYIQALNNEILIKNCLTLPEPHKHWKFILDALVELKNVVTPELKDQLKDVAWLATRENIPLSPSKIICLSSLKDEVDRLISANPGYFWQIDSLFSEIPQHKYFAELEKTFFSHHNDGLEKFAFLLEQNSKYAVGQLPALNLFELEAMLQILGQASCNQNLPGWRVMKAVYDNYGEESCHRYILPAVAHVFPEKHLLSILDWLESEYNVGDEQKKDNVLLCHLKYLGVLTRLISSHKLLEQINLLNQLGQWRATNELCADAEGVSPESLVNREQKRIIKTLLPKQKRTTATIVTSTLKQKNQLPKKRDLTPDLRETTEVLGKYFNQWESLVPPEVISGFFSILGDDPMMLELAAQFQGRHTVDWIRESIPWKISHETDQGGRRELWPYGLDLFQASSQLRFIVELVSGKEVSVISLLGNTITVGLNDKFSSLMLGKPFYEWPEGNINFVRIKLRKITDDQISPEDFSGYLKATAEYLLKAVYTQPNCNLTSLWDDLNKSEQLDVRIALRLVMKHIPFYLDQLGVHKHPLIAEAHNNWNDARYKVEEYHDNPDKTARYQQEEESKRLDLQKLLEKNSAVQSVVLDSVRKKMRDFQYTNQSVPFELFQNADDAFVEQLEIEAYPEQQLSAAETGHFVMQQDGDTIRFMHWGRPVNSTGTGGFPGRKRGFNQDLEKMLILSSSNKSSEQHLTGKFGLGFKSVLLVSDKPRFISGRLGVEIIAGLYPRKLSGHKSLYELLKQFSTDDNRPGTLIELPLKKSISGDIFRQFRVLAGILTVFSKRLKRIDLLFTEKPQENAQWLPRKIISLPDVVLEKGSMVCRNGENKIQVDAIHFRCVQGGGLLVGINSRGCNSLPDIPPIWIVAPTREKGNLGFCINGNFEVDAGRARLAGESGQNKKEAQRIGKSVGEILCELFKQTSSDWPTIKEQLNLNSKLSHYEYWKSVWDTFTKTWFEPSEKQLDSEVFDVVNNLFAGNAGLGMLINKEHALPNGLWGEDFQYLIDPKEIRYVLRDSLSKEIVFKALSGWKLFKDKITPSTVISAEIFPSLGKILPGFTQKKDQWQSIRLAQVLNWLKDDNYHITPETADILGGIISKEFLEKLQGTNEGLSEFSEIKKELEEFKFRALDGSWYFSSELLRSVSFGAGDDEPLRANFAPKAHLLALDYAGPAIDFFIVCRGDMVANSTTLASWVLAAKTEQQRTGALEYFKNGELAEHVARALRYQGFEQSWLTELNLESSYFDEWQDEDIKELLFRMLPSLDDLERGLSGEDYYEQETTVYSPPDVTATLENIHTWWRENQDEYLAKYEAKTYPGNSIFVDLENDGRTAWLTLLMIGAFHTLGRATPEQHRGFISMCQEKGWWQTFAQKNPQKHPDKWMGILEEYIDDQVDDSRFEYWMALFPKIYKFARDIEDYIEIFYSLETQGENVDVTQTMTPKTFSDFQGGGIVAAPIARTLGMGVPFVLREMMRKELFTQNQPNIKPFCYVPIGRVRNLFGRMNCSGLENGESHLVKSEIIHDFLCEHIGQEKADFNNGFDIPFQFVADDLELQEELFE